jgi:hypothetical protein
MDSRYTYNRNLIDSALIAQLIWFVIAGHVGSFDQSTYYGRGEGWLLLKCILFFSA